MAKKGLGYLLADEAAGLAGAFRSRLIAERLALKTQDGTLGKPTTEPQDAELENMEIRIGDDTHYHQATQSMLSKAWPILLAAALGAGSAVTANKLIPTTAPQTTPQDVPEYNLRISTPSDVVSP